MKYLIVLTLALVGCTKSEFDDMPVSVERGVLVAQSHACTYCHSTDGSLHTGPTWKGLYDSTVILRDGKSVVANKKYIIESIENPSAKIVKGFSPVMPTDRLSSSDLESVLLYIQSLK